MTAPRSLFLGITFLVISLPAFAKPLSIVTSISILADLTQQITGPDTKVTSLIGPEGEAHGFQPTPTDARLIANADLVIVNGLGLEGWMDRLIQASGYRGRVLALGEGIPHLRQQEEEGNKVSDPHAWQDIANVRFYVAHIADTLAATDPTQAEIFVGNARKLDQELAELDQWVKQQIATVPMEKRVVLTSHDAFGYFGQAYGISFLAPVGISSEEEPSAETLKNLIEQIRSGKISTLFPEPKANRKILKTLAEETHAKIGGALYSDTLSLGDGPAPHYQDMFRHNVPLLVEAMQANE